MYSIDDCGTLRTDGFGNLDFQDILRISEEVREELGHQFILTEEEITGCKNPIDVFCLVQDLLDRRDARTEPLCEYYEPAYPADGLRLNLLQAQGMTCTGTAWLIRSDGSISITPDQVLDGDARGKCLTRWIHRVIRILLRVHTRIQDQYCRIKLQEILFEDEENLDIISCAIKEEIERWTGEGTVDVVDSNIEYADKVVRLTIAKKDNSIEQSFVLGSVKTDIRSMISEARRCIEIMK